MSTLYDIIKWVRHEGEVQAENRLRMRTLPYTTREGLAFTSINASTAASRELIAAMRKEAGAVVGKPCPF